MNNIIVFGSTGMLGRYVEDYLSKFFTVFCVNRHQFDVEKDDFSKLQKIADSYEISSHDVLINCIGLMPHRFNKHSLSKDGYDDEAYRRFILVNSIFASARKTASNHKLRCHKYNLGLRLYR